MTEISRRNFIQLSVLSTGALALSGCKNEAIWKQEWSGQYGGLADKAYPYVDQPDGAIDGVPAYYASTCQMCSAGCGIYVRTLGGRANKIEGNPAHPVSGGKTCLRGQLALQSMYNPDRLMKPMQRTSRPGALTASTWDDALQRTVTALNGSRGRTAIVVDGDTVGRSPTKTRLIENLRNALGAELTQFSVVDDSPWREAAARVYGRRQLPDYRLDLADLIVSFGGNFLEAWPSPVQYGRRFGEFRQGARRSPGDHGQFIYVGPRMSMTAAKADRWLPCRSGTERIVALGVQTALGRPGIAPTDAAEASGLTVEQITGLADLFRGAGARAVAIGGDGMYANTDTTAAFVDVERLNIITGSTCVEFGDSLLPSPTIKSGLQPLMTLVERMNAGQVGALILIGPINPAFTLPAAVGWAAASAKVPFIAALGSFLDESAAGADVALAARTFLEEWGDFVPSVLPSGFSTASMTQPVIDPSFITIRHDLDENNRPRPMMDTREIADILIDLSNRVGGKQAVDTPRDAVRQTWASIGSANLAASDVGNDTSWSSAVSRGGKWTEYAAARPKEIGRPVASPTSRSAHAGNNTFSLLLFPHLYYDDGRHANLTWAQEMPDPMTASVWNAWVEINMQVAHRLDIRTGDLVRLTGPGGFIDVPAVPYPGIHPETVAMPIGQGHDGYGRAANATGMNPLAIVGPIADPQSGAFAFSCSSVSLRRIASAQSGYHPEQKTLVLVQDRPNGQEPDAVKNLIHETAQEWRKGPGANAEKPRRSRPVI